MDRRRFLTFFGAAAAAGALDAAMPRHAGAQGIPTLDARRGGEGMSEVQLQASFLEKHRKSPTRYGDRLYTNAELLDPQFAPQVKSPEYSITHPIQKKYLIYQYFLRNGFEQTMVDLPQLGAKRLEVTFNDAHKITSVFARAGIDIRGVTVQLVEIDAATSDEASGITGGQNREAHLFGGKDEQIMFVESFRAFTTPSITHVGVERAKTVGFKTDDAAEYAGMIANETLHALNARLFADLFANVKYDGLTEPLASFKSDIVPGLAFKNDAQADEFLSDVMNWVVGAPYGTSYRFFSQLGNLNSGGIFSNGEDGQYFFSYQVLKRAMIEVLSKKPGMDMQNAERIVGEIITLGEQGFDRKEDVMAAQFFTEADFVQIASIFEQVGVEVLKVLKPLAVVR
jgi:hypothetical protein